MFSFVLCPFPAEGGRSPTGAGNGQFRAANIAVLVTAGKLRPLGGPNTNAVKFFSAVELMALLADREWLDEATKTIGQFWKRKNARRNTVTSERPSNLSAS